jgi:succinate dehydrogenase/fumarate reductase flavoprotein subunit
MTADRTEVLVVGGGAAGLAAAVTAATLGARTTLVEKRAALGGTTALSVGSFSAAGTRLQRRRGIADSPEAFLEDMAAFDPALMPRDAPALRALLAAEAGPTLAWLESLGVVFTGPYPEPPNRVPRLHNAVPGPLAYIRRLRTAARRAGVRVVCEARAEAALVSDGRVVGLVCSRRGQSIELRGSRGVVLATGDFSGDDELRCRYLPAAAAAAIPINPHATGDGHRLATAVGADTRNMDVVFGPQLRFPPARLRLVERLPTWPAFAKVLAAIVNRMPPDRLRPLTRPLLIAPMSPSRELFAEGAILVNLDGDRFTDERRGVAELSSQRERTGYIVLDLAIASGFNAYPRFVSTAPGIGFAYLGDYARGRPDLVHVGDVTRLAARLRLDAERLRSAAASAPRPLGSPLVALGPVRSMLTVTEGGLAIDTRCRVLDRKGCPIPGLFAAGGAGQGGLQLLGHGLHIAWAMTSGRVAGAAAAGDGAERSPARPRAAWCGTLRPAPQGGASAFR